MSKFYRVEHTPTGNAKWSTSAAGAGTVRKEMVEAGCAKKDLESTEHDIDLTKAGLLEWLNQNSV